MPRICKGSNLDHHSRKSIQTRNERAQRTNEQIQEEREITRHLMSQLRETQSQDARDEINEQRRIQQRQTLLFFTNRNRESNQQRQ